VGSCSLHSYQERNVSGGEDKLLFRVVTVLVALLAAAAAASVVLLVKPAEAAFFGENGKIAFTSNRTTGTGVDNPTGDKEIFVMDSDGTNLVQLTNNTAGDFDPTFSPDGTQIAFESTRDGNSEIYTMNPDGTHQTNRSKKASTADFSPAWSPDSQKIAFARTQDGNSEIFTMNANGSSQKNVSNDPRLDDDPAWSPDGQKITFSSERNAGTGVNNPTGDGEIFTINPDGTGLTQLTTNTVADAEPDWAPDATKIAFRNSQDVFVMNANGTSPQNLTLNTGTVSLDPAWSPDGQQIAFENRDGSISPQDKDEIFVMDTNPATNDATNLTDNSTANPSIDDFAPSWEPMCTITGTTGDDQGANALIGTSDRDFICGLEGNDEIKAETTMMS
jgi:Tol biopolymer transport system component